MSQQVAQEPWYLFGLWRAVSSKARPANTRLTTHAQEQKPCHFLTLSREIRDMIYGYVLVNEHTIEPHPPFLEDKREQLRPQITSLLRTNKLISAEARQTLYGKNHWRIPVVDTIDSSTIFHKYPELFHHITLAFDQRDLAPAKRLSASKGAHTRGSQTPIKDIEAHRARNAHAHMEWLMGELWLNTRFLLKIYLPYVKTITLDLENFACPGGCCRLRLCKPNGKFYTRFLFMLRGKELKKHFGTGVMLPKVYVKGLLNEQEREMFYTTLGFLEVPFDEEEIGQGAWNY